MGLLDPLVEHLNTVETTTATIAASTVALNSKADDIIGLIAELRAQTPVPQEEIDAAVSKAQAAAAGLSTATAGLSAVESKLNAVV